MLDEMFFNLAELDEEGDDLDCSWCMQHSFVEEWEVFIPEGGKKNVSQGTKKKGAKKAGKAGKREEYPPAGER